MEISIRPEVLEASLKTVSGFVYKPGTAGVAPTMSAVLICAPEKGEHITFVGNNASQRIKFDVRVESIAAAGRVLVSVADFQTAVSTISDKDAPVRVVLGESGLEIHGKRESVNIPVHDVDAARSVPREPVEVEGSTFSVKVEAAALPHMTNRTALVVQESRLPNLAMWLDGDELCLCGFSATGMVFTSAKGATTSGDVGMLIWEPQCLRRVVDLMSDEDTVTFAQDDDESTVLVTITGERGTFVVQQSLEEGADAYEKALKGVRAKARDVMGNGTVVRTKVSNSDVVRAIESAQRVRAIGGRLDKSTSRTTFLTVTDDVAIVALPDESFSAEIDAERLEGTTDLHVAVDPLTTQSILGPLGSMNITFHMPKPDEEERKTSFYLITCDASFEVKDDVPFGYWALAPFRSQRTGGAG